MSVLLTTLTSFLYWFSDSRGFMTQNGQPDNPRSARYILKDFLCGKLLFCQAPPGVNQSNFNIFTVKRKHIPPITSAASRAIRVSDICIEIIVLFYFHSTNLSLTVHSVIYLNVLSTSWHSSIVCGAVQCKRMLCKKHEKIK